MCVYNVYSTRTKHVWEKKECNEYRNCSHKHLQAQFYNQNIHTCYPFAEFQDNQLEGCLHIQMRYGSTKFQIIHHLSRKKLLNLINLSQ